MLRSVRSLFAALISAVAFLIPTLASAQVPQFKDHYQELVQDLNPGQVMYLQIPRQGWPVMIQISVTDPGNNVAGFVTSLTVVDSAAGNGTLTAPISPAVLAPLVTCNTFSNIPSGLYECSVQNLFTVGNTDFYSAQPHMLFIRSDYSSVSRFRITMWY